MKITADDILALSTQPHDDMFVPREGSRGTILSFNGGTIWLMWFPTESDYLSNESALDQLVPGLTRYGYVEEVGRVVIAVKDELDRSDDERTVISAIFVLMAAMSDVIAESREVLAVEDDRQDQRCQSDRSTDRRGSE